jgi:phosphoribosylanthranilate isomerase
MQSNVNTVTPTSTTAVKICGMRDPLAVQRAANFGAIWIGMIFHGRSKRNVSREQAKKIAAAAIANNIIPVAVFVEQTASDMQEICELTGITTVELQGDMCKKQHKLLPDHYHRIYARPVQENGEICADEADGLKYCDPERDFILFDNLQPGTGKTFNWKNFNYTGPFRWFLAGGLTPANVGLAINQLQPHAVTVSSGVENALGEKEERLMREFILNSNLTGTTDDFTQRNDNVDNTRKNRPLW